MLYLLLECYTLQVPHFRFPNLCHSEYDGTMFSDLTDGIDMFLIDAENASPPFESWATTPAPTPPPPGTYTHFLNGLVLTRKNENSD